MQGYKIAIKARGEHGDGTELTKFERVCFAQQVERELVSRPGWLDTVLDNGGGQVNIYLPDGGELHIDIAVITAA